MNKIFAFLLILLIAIPSVLAKVPQVNVVNEGYDIKYPSIEALKLSREIELNFHVYNLSTGYPIKNTSISCYFHLYNNTGYHLYTTQVYEFVNDYDFSVNILKENFSYVGDYSYVFQCNSSAYGGFVSQGFKITNTGEVLDVSWEIVIIIMFLGIAGLMFYLSTTFKSDPFKTLFIMFGMGSILLSIQFARILVENSAIALSEDIVNLIMPLFIFGIVTFSLLIAYLFILLMVKTIKMLKGKGK